VDQNVRRVSDVVSVEIILGGHVKGNLTGNTEYMGVALLPPLFWHISETVRVLVLT